MARSALRLAVNNPRKARAETATEVVAQSGSRWQGSDPVFFHRSQIKVGVTIVDYGRVNHGARWTVIEILTFHVLENGRLRRVRVDAVERMTDHVVLRRVGGSEIKERAFGSLSYSAIWRIA